MRRLMVGYNFCKFKVGVRFSPHTFKINKFIKNKVYYKLSKSFRVRENDTFPYFLLSNISNDTTKLSFYLINNSKFINLFLIMISLMVE